MLKIYYDSDANLKILEKECVTVLGYGSQGNAQALNLRDSGCNVIVGLRKDSLKIQKAKEEGLHVAEIREACEKASIIAILIPDEVQGEVYEKEIKQTINKNKMLLFSHGFAIHFSQIVLPDNVDVAMVAPKSPGYMVRKEYLAGRGVPALLAVEKDYSGTAKERALAYAKAIGATKAGVIETTFKEETETDIFGEQAVLCGGLTALMEAGFNTLVDAGYQPEIAYFECINEMKLIVDLIYKGGFTFMHKSISNTAEYGDYISQEKIITDEVKNNMKKILQNIQKGKFAQEWILENKAGQPVLKAMRKIMENGIVEQVGASLRRMMPWLNERDK